MAKFPGGQESKFEDESDDESSAFEDNDSLSVSRPSSNVPSVGQSSSIPTTGSSLRTDKIYCTASSGVCIN